MDLSNRQVPPSEIMAAIAIRVVTISREKILLDGYDEHYRYQNPIAVPPSVML